jgi:hypothetical protein
MRSIVVSPYAGPEAIMNKESSSDIYPSGSWISKSVAAFLAGALSIAVGAGALGAAVASIVVLVLDGPTAIRGRMVDASFIHPVSGVSDDLARLFERTASERSEISDSRTFTSNLSRRERMAPRSPLQTDE